MIIIRFYFFTITEQWRITEGGTLAPLQYRTAQIQCPHLCRRLVDDIRVEVAAPVHPGLLVLHRQNYHPIEHPVLSIDRATTVQHRPVLLHLDTAVPTDLHIHRNIDGFARHRGEDKYNI